MVKVDSGPAENQTRREQTMSLLVVIRSLYCTSRDVFSDVDCVNRAWNDNVITYPEFVMIYDMCL